MRKVYEIHDFADAHFGGSEAGDQLYDYNSWAPGRAVSMLRPGEGPMRDGKPIIVADPTKLPEALAEGTGPVYFPMYHIFHTSLPINGDLLTVDPYTNLPLKDLKTGLPIDPNSYDGGAILVTYDHVTATPMPVPGLFRIDDVMRLAYGGYKGVILTQGTLDFNNRGALSLRLDGVVCPA